MSITRDPIFKSVIFALTVIYIALASQSIFAAKGGKPPPEPVPASDVDCIGCVDTVDIADEAVGTPELSAEIQALLTELNNRIYALENSAPVVGADCRPLNLVPGADLRNCTLSHIIIDGVDLTGANLSGAELRGASLQHVNFTNADLSNAKITRTNFNYANLTGANLDNVDGACEQKECTQWYVHTLSFRNSNLTNASFVNANLAWASFEDVVSFSGADFTNSNVSRADLSYSDLSGTTMTDAIAFGTSWSLAICPDGFYAGTSWSCEEHY